MAKKKNTDDRKQFLIRFRIDENSKVSFIDPCSDYMPANLFCKVMEAISNVEKEWNDKIINPKTMCLRDKTKICNLCHDCDVYVLNPDY